MKFFFLLLFICLANQIISYEYDVFFYETFQEEEFSLKKHLSKDIKAGFTSKTIQEYHYKALPAKIISLRTQSIIPNNWANDLDAILTRSTGYDHLLKYLKGKESSIQCGYLPLYCNRSVAEQALMLWLSLLRKLPKQKQQFSTFSRDGLTGQECSEKVLLIVGIGKIGYEIYRIGKGLDMKVLGVDIDEKYTDIDYISIEEGIEIADIIVCSMNLTENNYRYFDYSLLKRAKKGVIFVNISRGEISPSYDLLRLIEEDHLGGVGLDVYIEEPLLSTTLREGLMSENMEVKASIELSKHCNTILTPHNAFNTEEAVENKSEQTVRQLDCFIKNNYFLWPIP